jgi:hypothetical protein
MDAYEKKGWKWCSGRMPHSSSTDKWKEYEQRTIVEFDDSFVYGDMYSGSNDYESISVDIAIKRLFPEHSMSSGTWTWDLGIGFKAVEYTPLQLNHEEIMKQWVTISMNPSDKVSLTELNKPKEKTMRISKLAKKLLDKDTRTLIKAGFLDSELDLTARGSEALHIALYPTVKEELVKMAEEQLEDEKETK